MILDYKMVCTKVYAEVYLFPFKSFKIMSLHQTDIQTRRRKKNSIFPDFPLFF